MAKKFIHISLEKNAGIDTYADLLRFAEDHEK